MKQFSLLLISVSLLFGCSKLNDNSFTLVCDVKSNWSGRIVGIGGSEIKNETFTFVFKNKLLENYTCSTWTNENIVCERFISTDTEQLQEKIKFDRQSGLVESRKYRSDTLPPSTELKTYSGKCERVKENKF